jgi:hypothetical protein
MTVATRCNAVPRPRRNRVTPFGKIEATPYKGTMMGNRGDLHARDGTVVRTWKHRSWISCVTAEAYGPVVFDAPGRYTPLFFLDEAVALSAGHRPCGRCRAKALRYFRACWQSAHGLSAETFVPVTTIDRELHASRLGQHQKRRSLVRFGDLPNGVFIALPAADDSIRSQDAWLLWDGKAYPWSHAGYGVPTEVPNGNLVAVLTPQPIVDVLRAGYSQFVLPKLAPEVSFTVEGCGVPVYQRNIAHNCSRREIDIIL